MRPCAAVSTSTAKNVAQRKPERAEQHRALEIEATAGYAPGIFGELAEAYMSVHIRRTVRTGLSGLRVDPSHRVGSDIAERIFGHVIGGVRESRIDTNSSTRSATR
jgi:hypothetical protein